MNKILVLNKQIAGRNAALTKAKAEVDKMDEKSKDFEKRLGEIPDGDAEALDALIKESDQLDTDKRSALEGIEALEAEIEDLMELRTAAEEKPIEVQKQPKAVKRVGGEDLAVRNSVNAYIRTKDINSVDKRFVSTDGEVLIPTSQVFVPKMETGTVYDLSTLVNKVSVSVPAGKYPIQQRATAAMHTVEELAKNPELAKPAFYTVTFSVDTYRGKVPVSQESIDDAAVDLLSLISADIVQQKLNTTNGLISAAFKSFPKKEVTSLDGLKDLMNVAIDPAYSVGIVATQSFFNFYDKLKDTTGRYLLQPDVQSPSGKSFEGKTITVVRDTDLGDKAGDRVAFIGDTKAAVTEFDRATITARWKDDDTYGQVLSIGMRTQIKAVDMASGYLVEVTGALDGVTIAGTAQVGQVLTANAVPSYATVTYKWKSASTATGAYSDISGATGKTYTPVTGDVGKFIKVEVTGSGTNTGTVLSKATAAVVAA